MQTFQFDGIETKAISTLLTWNLMNASHSRYLWPPIWTSIWDHRSDLLICSNTQRVLSHFQLVTFPMWQFQWWFQMLKVSVFHQSDNGSPSSMLGQGEIWLHNLADGKKIEGTFFTFCNVCGVELVGVFLTKRPKHFEKVHEDSQRQRVVASEVWGWCLWLDGGCAWLDAHLYPALRLHRDCCRLLKWKPLAVSEGTSAPSGRAEICVRWKAGDFLAVSPLHDSVWLELTFSITTVTLNFFSTVTLNVLNWVCVACHLLLVETSWKNCCLQLCDVDVKSVTDVGGLASCHTLLLVTFQPPTLVPSCTCAEGRADLQSGRFSTPSSLLPLHPSLSIQYGWKRSFSGQLRILHMFVPSFQKAASLY